MALVGMRAKFGYEARRHVSRMPQEAGKQCTRDAAEWQLKSCHACPVNQAEWPCLDEGQHPVLHAIQHPAREAL